MFTGLIESTGLILSIDQSNNGLKTFTIQDDTVIQDINIGDSISINGVCLTVIYFDTNSFQVQAIKETLNITNLSRLNNDDIVNLERAMLPTTRFGGHIVQGHVDGVSEIIHYENHSDHIEIKLSIPEHLMKYMSPKGSITVDGISLTLFDVCPIDNTATLSIIPETKQKTNISHRNIGDFVNIECDILMKHIDTLLQHQGGSKYDL